MYIPSLNKIGTENIDWMFGRDMLKSIRLLEPSHANVIAHKRNNANFIQEFNCISCIINRLN